MGIKSFELEIQPDIPQELSELNRLANDLYYSWNVETRELFRRLDLSLWERCNHNPKLFLRRVDQKKLNLAVNDSSYMEAYSRAISSYHSYKGSDIASDFKNCLDLDNDLVAYFCLEFGFHESVPIYSGGLGILAADLCKAASDLAVPFVGVGLLYRQGYFTQEINESGSQIANYYQTDFNDLPIKSCLDEEGKDLHVHLELGGRTITAKAWEVTAGNIRLYLLDCDIDKNDDLDRNITHQLYGGGKDTRILQEAVLGIGGVRLLRALNIKPTIWHINEGHAAFSTLERCRENVSLGMNFSEALELNASNSVFTTHTPVPAGHDIFTADLVESKLGSFVKSLGISLEEFMLLGDGVQGGNLNMTTLALRSSRFHNGVSRIHGGVASKMESHIWPQIDPDENPIEYITNGVHVSTFLAQEWTNLLNMRHGDWRRKLSNCDFWNCLDEIPSHRFWSLRLELKKILLSEIQQRIEKQFLRNGKSDASTKRITDLIQTYGSELLIFGFARRFATYKRANLLFYDLERLARVLNQTDKPVLIVFAGKAHPKDMPGQDLIRLVHEISSRPEFIGKIIFVENYDMVLARRLVAGVDVWINTPEYPLEASGTSGQKAGMNGVINLSVLDGWWGEGYNGNNGWAITPYGHQFDDDYRNQHESNELMDIIEYEIIPLYFKRNQSGCSDEWIAKAKESMKSIIPNYNSQRMLSDYIHKFYSPAKSKHKVISDQANASVITEWKSKIRSAWAGVKLRFVSKSPTKLKQGNSFKVEVALYLNGLESHDIIVECLIGQIDNDEKFVTSESFNLQPTGDTTGDEQLYAMDLVPQSTGLQSLRIRAYPYHEHLCHRFELGCMIWLEE